MSNTVQNPVNKIYTRVQTRLKESGVCEYVTTKPSSTSSQFPCFYIKPMGQPGNSYALCGHECSVSLTVQGEAYTVGTGALSIAMDIDSVAHDAFVSMGFQRISGPEPMDASDKSITRVVSRWRRTLGNGEDLYSEK